MKITYYAPWNTCYNEPYEIAIEIGFISDESKGSWHIPYFDSALALENKQYCGTITSDKLHIINTKLQEMAEIVLALNLDMACVDRLESREEYGLLTFEHQWKRKLNRTK